ncbi:MULTISPECIES: lysylphosphatidylglycerol synthase transmembrane domain-containing protein [Natrialbaceae]|uniref:lysylphosphatidylglycerol synthase transmembrane domain-containing protein n=1 Tax=Natrialbaceae TaxID=1644061 RepID=UPI00207C8303|nr:lysylphosphatidylglycerol synthase transmembrane domain-containing protein [Natronococcus sp. CG52]
MKRRIAVGFTFAVFLLVVLISVVGSQDLLAELSRADYRLLTFGVLSGLLALTFRGLVWEQFLSLIDEGLSRGQIAGLFLTAMFVKYVTPYGQIATEPFVAYLVSRDEEMAYEDGLASVLSADLLNYAPYYTFGFAALGLIVADDALGDGLINQFVAFGVLFLVIATVVVLVVRQPELVYSLVVGVANVVRRLIGRFTTRFDDRLAAESVRSRLEGFYATVGTITADRRTVVVAAAYAHLGMAFLMLPVYVGAASLGYQLPLSVVALAVAFGKLGSAVPAPGGTGGVEAMVTAVLTTLGGLSPAAALTVALIYRACTYWLTIGVGGAAAGVLLLREP